MTTLVLYRCIALNWIGGTTLFATARTDFPARIPSTIFCFSGYESTRKGCPRPAIYKPFYLVFVAMNADAVDVPEAHEPAPRGGRDSHAEVIDSPGSNRYACIRPIGSLCW